MFSRKDWLMVWDHLVSAPVRFLYSFLVAVLVENRVGLLGVSRAGDFEVRTARSLHPYPFLPLLSQHHGAVFLHTPTIQQIGTNIPPPRLRNSSRDAGECEAGGSGGGV